MLLPKCFKSSVQINSDLNASFGVAEPVVIGLDLIDAAFEREGIVGLHVPVVFEAEDLFKIDILGEFPEGVVFEISLLGDHLGGRVEMAVVVPLDPFLEILVSLMDCHDIGSGHFVDQPVLHESEDSLDLAFALRLVGSGVDAVDPEFFQGSLELRDRLFVLSTPESVKLIHPVPWLLVQGVKDGIIVSVVRDGEPMCGDSFPRDQHIGEDVILLREPGSSDLPGVVIEIEDQLPGFQGSRNPEVDRSVSLDQDSRLRSFKPFAML